MPTATETMSSASIAQTSSSQTAPISRRVLRKTLNDALAIASNAVQLDTAGDYAQAMEAYQQSVYLLDQGISLMRIQRESGAERPGRDTSHEISQLETIREKYASRIAVHKSERTRKAAAAAPEPKEQPQKSFTSSEKDASSGPTRRPRTPQSAIIPPPQPPPSAPLPPIPQIVQDDYNVLQTTRPRGASLPASQVEARRHDTPSNHMRPALPSLSTTSSNATAISSSTNVVDNTSQNNSSTAYSPSPSPVTTIQLDALPVPKKRSKTPSRPQTAPGPSSEPGPTPTPIRVRTTSIATGPKRSHSSTNLSAAVSQINGKLMSPSVPRSGFLTPSPIVTSKQSQLISLRKTQIKTETPAFLTIYGLHPITKIAAPPPPPMPTDPQRRPYHLLRLISGTLGHPQAPFTSGTTIKPHRGGFITAHLFIPVMLWHQSELWNLILNLQEKARILETLRESLRTVHEASVTYFGPVFFSAVRSPTTPSKSPVTEKALPNRPIPQAGFDDPIEWLHALEKLTTVISDIEKTTSKKLGLGENGASVTKRMVDWSTRVAKKAVGGKGPSNDLMESYVDALSGVCNFGAMVDAHYCALRTIIPSARSAPSRRPTISRSNTTTDPSKPISPSQNNPTSGPIPDFRSDPDVLPPAISQLVPKYSSLPKFIQTQALAHLESTTKIFSSVIVPLIMRDLAVLIEGLQESNGEWMGRQL